MQKNMIKFLHRVFGWNSLYKCYGRLGFMMGMIITPKNMLNGITILDCTVISFSIICFVSTFMNYKNGATVQALVTYLTAMISLTYVPSGSAGFVAALVTIFICIYYGLIKFNHMIVLIYFVCLILSVMLLRGMLGFNFFDSISDWIQLIFMSLFVWVISLAFYNDYSTKLNQKEQLCNLLFSGLRQDVNKIQKQNIMIKKESRSILEDMKQFIKDLMNE